MPSSSSTLDLVDLSRRLKQEKLFVANEKKEIEGLNRKVQLLSTGLLHQTWLTGQNRLALENLSKGPVLSPFSCPFVSSCEGGGDVTENLELVQAQKVIPARYLQSYVDLISLLRGHPDIAALCISTYEKEKNHLVRPPGLPNISVGDILQAILNLYGGIGGPLLEDGTLLLKLLSSLAGLQLVGSESPRRVLRQGSSAFSTLYKLISETIPSSRLFLVGALHEPVTQFLSSPELHNLGNNLPTSPNAAADVIGCFAGNGPTNGDIASLDRTEKMAKLTKLFVESILDNIHAFPTGLAWLIKSIHTQLSTTCPEKEVATICNDLIWALFICPAVTNPEPFGVTDTPVGSQARHTLSQVATILQALALHPWEGTDPRLAEYISYLDPESMSSVLDHVLSIDGLQTEQTGIISSLNRRTILIPENLLQPLFTWLKECLILLEQNGKLTDLEIFPTLVKLTSTVADCQTTIANNSKLATQDSKTNSTSSSNLSLSSTGSPSHAANLLANGRKVLLNRRGDNRPAVSAAGVDTPMSVIVFSITHSSWEWVGMLPESEVISSTKGNKVLNGVPDVDSLPGLDYPDNEERDDRSSIGEKRTRFSLSHDDGSVGTSDNLEVEAVSEAASTHSVSSSIELEDQNDNLSDMLSANVSGRGTPNVSGRNTPLSQAEQEEEENANDAALDDDIVMDEAQDEPPQINNPANLNNLNINAPRPNPSKQARSEIEDKFCKFEIKKLFGGDETVSLVSDTWSTDVLASDSEMGGDAQHTLNQLGLLNVGNRSTTRNAQGMELAAAVNQDSILNNDTMSEAWSTDVAASDIERLNDFDTDDTASVARSDETGRSETDGMAYDTPRSSVSGSGPYRPYRRPDQEPDLLMFDEMQARNNESAARQPSTPQNNEGITLSAPELINLSTSSIMDTPPANESLLIPDIPTPASSQHNVSVSSSNSLQTPGSNSRSGAIPKTISFDKTAERGDRENWDDENGRTKRFFRNFRLPFKGRTRKTRGQDDRFMDWDRMPENPSLSVPRLRKSFSEDVGIPSPNQGINESSDEILAKYRRKPSLTDSGDSPMMQHREGSNGSGTKSGPSVSGNPSVARKESLKISRSDFIVDSRKKLRNVLSNCDLQISQIADATSIDTSLVNLLRVEMATAVSRGDQVTAAHLQEAMRTVKQLGSDGCRKILRLMRDDYRRRSDYVSYLMRAKQGLLATIQFLERATVRAKHEGDTYSHYLINECIRVWLEETVQANLIEDFIKEFCNTTAVDEKIELLENFLCRLLDIFVGHRELTEWQLGRAENALEQVIVSKVYVQALYPNGDADIHRDVVLQEHIIKLAGIISPNHKDLRIPKSRLGECPWPPAQRELKMLSAYKTPSDKLRCVIRTSSLIMNLLSSSSEKVVAADDFIPVLVFVVIKCNPPALLSTIQYVNSFCGQRITGEDQYWWTQFCSAVEFIKTMDYND